MGVGCKKIGLIILNYNTADETCKCIESIRKYTEGVEYEIYIVDNMSKDNSFEVLWGKYSDCQDVFVIQSDKNGGYSAGNNIGIKKAVSNGCDVVFIVNSDVEIRNNTFFILTKSLLQEDSCMMIGPDVVTLDDKNGQLPRKRLNFLTYVFSRQPFCYIPYIEKKTNRLINISEGNKFLFDGSVSGCCFGIRAKDIIDIDYLDESVFLYYEEDILAYKMHAHNKFAMVDTDAHILHKENVSTKKEGNAFVQYHRWISGLYFLKTYAKINVLQRLVIALSNTVTWLLLSVISNNHKKMLKSFVKRNWSMVFGVERMRR